MKVVQSPAPSDSQLRLQEGDIVKVFGRLRKDGNYIAEVRLTLPNTNKLLISYLHNRHMELKY